MKRFIHAIVLLVAMLLSAPAPAVLIDISGVSLDSFVPNPIAPGQLLSPISYGYDFVDYDHSFHVANFDFAFTLSTNTTLGDSDDIPLGTLVSTTVFSSIYSGHASGTIYNSAGNARVPPSTVTGTYKAFLRITPESPDTDSTPNDAVGLYAGTVSVSGPTFLPGDYNKNGVVDAADYVVWRKLKGQSGSGLPADPNGDGTVDTSDYGIWRARFGGTTGSGTIVGGSVPEPGSLTLAAFVLTGGMLSVPRHVGRKPFRGFFHSRA